MFLFLHILDLGHRVGLGVAGVTVDVDGCSTFITAVGFVDNILHTFNHVDMSVKCHSCTLSWC